MNKEILRLYQERIDKYDDIFHEISQELDQLKVSQRQTTELEWENNSLASEVTQLRADIADMHSNLIKERDNHLEVVAENDRLRIHGHELERQVRLLTRLVDNSVIRERSHSIADSETMVGRPEKRFRKSEASQADNDNPTKQEYERKQLEIENETQQLTIDTMRIQLQEQKTNYVEMIEGLEHEFKIYRDAVVKEAMDRAGKVDKLEAELARVKELYRENLRDLVAARKSALESKHSVKQDSLILRSEILTLERRLEAEMERSRFLQSSFQ